MPRDPLDDLSEEEIEKSLRRRRAERKKAAQGLRVAVFEGESAARVMDSLGLSRRADDDDEIEDEGDEDEGGAKPRRGFFGGSGLGDTG